MTLTALACLREENYSFLSKFEMDREGEEDSLGRKMSEVKELSEKHDKGIDKKG